MYTENLSHVLNLLEISAQSGTLFLTPTVDKADASWQANCLLQEGKIGEIKIRRSSDGIILLGGLAALEWLTTQKGVYWQFKELPADALPSQCTKPIEEEITHKMPVAHPYALKYIPLPIDMESVPRRTFLGENLGVQGVPAHIWSREHRTVFLLVDGSRSKTEILRLLPASFDKLIDLILADLRSAGLIE